MMMFDGAFLYLILTAFCVVVKVSSRTLTQLADEVSDHFAFGAADAVELNTVQTLLREIQELAANLTYGGSPDPEQMQGLDENLLLPITVSQPGVTYANSLYLFEGDILLRPQQAEQILQTLRDSLRGLKKRSIYSAKRRRRKRKMSAANSQSAWSRNTPIDYVMQTTLSADAVQKIREGVRFWEESTCFRFREVGSSQGDHLKFFSGSGCYSMIGKTGGQQGISIGVGCENAGIVSHEMGHAFGLWHEQSRPDRGCCVRIKTENILRQMIGNFLTRSESEVQYHGTKYDLGSVMHYGSTAFTKDWNKLTVVTKKPGYQRTIGQRSQLSFYDVQIINKEYCGSNECGYRLPCENEGYQHPKYCNRCICPEGFGGTYCDSYEAPQPPGMVCGGIYDLSENWLEIKSPGYPNPGYSPETKCSWVLKVPEGRTVMLEFVDRFQLWCTSTCMDYVEIKNSSDLLTTGMRFCCYDTPPGFFYSAINKMLVLMRTSSLWGDVGFSARVRMKPSSEFRSTTTTTTTTTTYTATTPYYRTRRPVNPWNNWSSWSYCSKSCGFCGIQFRTRRCNNPPCRGQTHEHRNCGEIPCKGQLTCQELDTRDQCYSTVQEFCIKTRSSSIKCSIHTCCPPYDAVDGICKNRR